MSGTLVGPMEPNLAGHRPNFPGAELPVFVTHKRG